MKRRRIHRSVIALIPVIVLLFIPIFFQHMYRRPYRYCENCLHSNKEYFDELPSYIREDGISGTFYLNDENTPKEINEILESLNKQYQKDSDYPVFTAIEINNDDNGALAISLQAKKTGIKKRDAAEMPDIRCYYLVYIEPDHNGSIPAKNITPFYDNWRTWSQDIYSG